MKLEPKYKFQENVYENVICKMSAILFIPQFCFQSHSDTIILKITIQLFL